MPISDYLRDLRAVVGHRLLLLPAVASIVRDEHGRVLLVESADGGGWSLPAGGVEPGESPEAAVVREVAEETSLEVTSARLVAALGGEGFRATYPNGDEVEYTVCVFECAVRLGDPQAVDGEVSAFTWVEAGDVADRLALPYPPDLFVKG